MRRAADELLCLTPAAIREFRPRPLHELAAEAGARRASEARRRLAGLSPEERRQQLRRDWGRLLGDVEPVADPKVRRLARETDGARDGRAHRAGGRAGRRRPRAAAGPAAQAGDTSARGAGDVPRRASRPSWAGGRSRSRNGSGAGRRSAWSTCEGPARRGPATARGGTTVPRPRSPRPSGCSARPSSAPGCATSARSCATCGPAPTSTPAGSPCGVTPSPRRTRRVRTLAVPLDADPFPHQAEPLGGLLALFTALFEDGVRAVYVRGGLTGFESLLQSPVLLRPARRLDPRSPDGGRPVRRGGCAGTRPLRMEGLVDGLDRVVAAVEMARIMEPARSAYRALDAVTSLQLGEGDAASPPAARWLLGTLLAEPAPRRDR